MTLWNTLKHICANFHAQHAIMHAQHAIMHAQHAVMHAQHAIMHAQLETCCACMMIIVLTRHASWHVVHEAWYWLKRVLCSG